MKKKGYKKIGVFIVVLAFFFYFWESLQIPMEGAPDEVMRFDIPKFILKYGKLPIGDEKEIINATWGISYGFLPNLPGIIAAVFMKITLCFTDNSLILLRAARFVNVLASTTTVYLCLKIGREIFKKKSTSVLFAILCAFLPQFVFISSYFNNDAMSVFSTAIIIYAWILGIKNKWRICDCIMLAIGISICALSYYNAYGFLLSSIIVYCSSSYRYNRNQLHVFFGKGILILSLAILLSGWYFIRNFLIYDGDITGMSALRKTSELNAIDYLKPSVRQTPQKLGFNLKEMLFEPYFGHYWINYVAKSFIGLFGYMNRALRMGLYMFYCAFFGTGIGICFLSIIRRIKKLTFNEKLIICNLILCIIIPFILSIFYSYTSDYQPQGRYVMSILLPIMLMVAYGFERLTIRVNSVITKSISMNWILITVYIILFLYVFFNYLY